MRIWKDFILRTLLHTYQPLSKRHMQAGGKISKTEPNDETVPYDKPLGRKEIGRKLTLLRYELNTLSDQIGKSRDESVSFSYQRQYEARQREFNLYKDLKRRLQSVSLHSDRNESPKIGHQSFSLNRKECQELLQDYNSKSRLQQVGPQLSSSIKKKLQQKYLDYCKNKSAVPSYFSEVVPESQVMKYKGFLLFMKQAGLEEQLSFEERLRIFNRHSKFKKRLIFQQFYRALEDFCRIICDRHQTRFTQHNYRIFLTNILAKLQISFFTPQNHSIEKMQIHTGLFKQSMEDALADGRKLQDEKRANSILSKKKLLQRTKQPFPLVKRLSSLKRSQKTTTAIPIPILQNASSQTRIEPECISYSSLMKSRQKSPGKISFEYSRGKRNPSNPLKSQYEHEISALVDLEEPDTILDQILSHSFKF